MFTVIKRLEISASHKLVLPYRSKCASLHGHNWIEVTLDAYNLKKDV
ncbi:6-carboxytetrahydropterin synthase [uncultured Bacteroides sp.]|nr:6-carboxytetrahydropterin synthase [uncultured Bacteroides sp.]